MAKKQVNLGKLEEEIKSRKAQRNTTLVDGANVGSVINEGQVAPRDAFLYGLMESLKTGKKTKALEKVADINNGAVKKMAEKTNVVENSLLMSGGQQGGGGQPQQQVVPQQTPKTPQIPQDRENLMYEQFNKDNKTLADSIQNFNKTPYVGTKMNEQPQQLQGQPQGQMPLNEAYLAEAVQNIVDGYLVKNFGGVIEEAISNTVIEMYAVERIQKVLNENEDLIEKVVVDVIRKLQKKKKTKESVKA